MNAAVLLPVCVALGAGAGLLLRPRDVQEEPRDAVLSERVRELAGTLETLARSQDELARDVALRAAPERAALEPSLDDAEIAAAVERYLARDGTEPASAVRPSEVEDLPMQEILRWLAEPGRTGGEAEALLQEVREAGRFDEYVAAVEARAAAEPQNADFALSVAGAYLSQELDTSGTPESIAWAQRADAAFDRALELDPDNWRARFGKAIALSNWPDALGKRGEAIAQFEMLRAEQEAGIQASHHWRTYLYLGGLYERSGDRARAIATWEEGLARFPGNAEITERLAQARR
jgi:tetratricopeptide (TPR) repeat protein